MFSIYTVVAFPSGLSSCVILHHCKHPSYFRIKVLFGPSAESPPQFQNSKPSSSIPFLGSGGSSSEPDLETGKLKCDCVTHKLLSFSLTACQQVHNVTIANVKRLKLQNCLGAGKCYIRIRSEQMWQKHGRVSN